MNRAWRGPVPAIRQTIIAEAHEKRNPANNSTRSNSDDIPLGDGEGIPDAVFGATNPNIPHSTVGVTFGFKMSEQFCSVEIQAHVSVPCVTGSEAEGLTYAEKQAGGYVEKNKVMVRETLDEVIFSARRE